MASRRNYITRTDVESLTGVSSVTDAEISKAEAWIDRWAAYQDSFFPDPKLFEVAAASNEAVSEEVSGESAGTTTITVSQDSSNINRYLFCRVRVVGGTGEGQEQPVLSSSSGEIVTELFTTALDATSVIEIFQPGKFPRISDVRSLNNVYYPTIPQAVKDAVAYQVEYVRERGNDFFTGDDAEFQSEQVGDMQYTKGQGAASGLSAYIAPKARDLLHGIRNLKGQWADE